MIRTQTMYGSLNNRQSVVYRYKTATLLLIIPMAFIAKCLVEFVLPPKYFFDNTRILGMVLGDNSTQAWSGSYEVAANLFKKLNVLGFDSLFDWSTCFGIVFTVLLLFMLSRIDPPDFFQFIFTLCCVGLLNIYVFNIGKDIIQFAFFLMVYIALLLPFKKPVIPLLLTVLIFYWESTFFRKYYLLIAAFAVITYCVLWLFRRKKHAFTTKSVFGLILCLYLCVYAVLFVAQFAMPEEFGEILGVREGSTKGREGGADSVTVILNWIPGNGLVIFMLNYLVNAIRMMLPLELLTKSLQYIPFLVFQLLVTFYLIHLLRQINQIHDRRQLLALCIFLGYLLASFTFEPDFGSWVRHEIATFPVLHLLVLNKNQTLKCFSKKDVRHIYPALRRSAKSANQPDAI